MVLPSTNLTKSLPARSSHLLQSLRSHWKFNYCTCRATLSTLLTFDLFGA